jgi:hypothetical protein
VRAIGYEKKYLSYRKVVFFLGYTYKMQKTLTIIPIIKNYEQNVHIIVDSSSNISGGHIKS